MKKSFVCHIIIFSHKRLEELKSLVKQLSTEFHVDKISSVYEVQSQTTDVKNIHDLRSVESFAGLCLAIRLSTELDGLQTYSRLRQIEQNTNEDASRQKLKMTLLFFEGETRMIPDFTIPHPEAHARPEMIVPAAEVWGDYCHPILDKSIVELSGQFSSVKWGEFCAQGKSLLDF